MNTHNEWFEFRALSSEETFHFFWDLIEEIDSQNLVEDAKKTLEILKSCDENELRGTLENKDTTQINFTFDNWHVYLRFRLTIDKWSPHTKFSSVSVWEFSVPKTSWQYTIEQTHRKAQWILEPH